MSEEIKFDFDSNIKYLINTRLSNTIENDIILQDKIMKSSDFNTTLNYIEDSLNFLYEKNRVLEDVIRYSNLYLKNEINTAISECKSLLAAIENDRDMTKNNSYIKYSTPFILGATTHADRDNSVISETVLYDGKLTLSSTTINSYKPINAKTSMKNINNNVYNSIENLIEDNTYRTFYMFKAPQGNSITESIVLNLETPVKMNKISFNVSNCLIEDIIFLLEDNSELSIGNNVGLFNTSYVKQVTIKIHCSNYITSQIDYNEYYESNADFWSALDEIKSDENLLLDNPKFYYYLFGIDNLELDYVTTDEQSGFFSKEIKLGKLLENEYITLETTDSIERGSIEYYIVDGTNTIPILPEDISEIIDERLFYKSPTRFTVDITKPVIIKKNGNMIKMTLQEAININDTDSIYTVSYTPIVNNISSINNPAVKIKAIIRNYDKNFNSFIKNINIKKYGGGNIWIDKI